MNGSAASGTPGPRSRTRIDTRREPPDSACMSISTAVPSRVCRTALRHDVLDGAAQQLGVAAHAGRARLDDPHRAVTAARLEVRVLGHLADERAEVDGPAAR